MGAITAVEDYLIARVKADALGQKLRAVESLPGVWDAATLSQVLKSMPGVFISFLGGSGGPSGNHTAALESRWTVYAVTGHASGQAARRRGDGREIGAYEILERLVPLLHGHTIPDYGTLKLTDISNLFTDGADFRGVALYGATFTLPLAFPPVLDASALDDFTTFGAAYDLAPPDGKADAEDQVTGLNL